MVYKNGVRFAPHSYFYYAAVPQSYANLDFGFRLCGVLILLCYGSSLQGESADAGL